MPLLLLSHGGCCLCYRSPLVALSLSSVPGSSSVGPGQGMMTFISVPGSLSTGDCISPDMYPGNVERQKLTTMTHSVARLKIRLQKHIWLKIRWHLRCLLVHSKQEMIVGRNVSVVKCPKLHYPNIFDAGLKCSMKVWQIYRWNKCDKTNLNHLALI